MSHLSNFIAIDFETAIRSPESAIAIGLVKFRNLKLEASFYSLICPPKLYIRPDFTKIHGLTIDDVKEAPSFNNIWDSMVKPFIESYPLVAHNSKFDIGVLNAVLKYYDIPIPELQSFCTLKMARHVWSGLKSYSLTALAENFGIHYNAHNALDDATVCGKLIQTAVSEKSSKCLLDKYCLDWYDSKEMESVL